MHLTYDRRRRPRSPALAFGYHSSVFKERPGTRPRASVPESRRSGRRPLTVAPPRPPHGRSTGTDHSTWCCLGCQSDRPGAGARGGGAAGHSGRRRQPTSATGLRRRRDPDPGARPPVRRAAALRRRSSTTALPPSRSAPLSAPVMPSAWQSLAGPLHRSRSRRAAGAPAASSPPRPTGRGPGAERPGPCPRLRRRRWHTSACRR